MQVFADELTHLLVEQKMSFNLPVVQRRRRERPAVLGLLHQLGQRHDGVHPGLAKTEGMLFKYGSGTGTKLRRCVARASSYRAAAGLPARCRS